MLCLLYVNILVLSSLKHFKTNNQNVDLGLGCAGFVWVLPREEQSSAAVKRLYVKM